MIFLYVILVLHSTLLYIYFSNPTDLIERKVRCLCCQNRDAKKYKRHLTHHVKLGEISGEELIDILFQTRYARIGSQCKSNSRKNGILCTVLVNEVPCSALVLELRTHLKRIHALSSTDEIYDKAIGVEESTEIQVFFEQKNVPKYNPIHDLLLNVKVRLHQKYYTFSVKELIKPEFQVLISRKMIMKTKNNNTTTLLMKLTVM